MFVERRRVPRIEVLGRLHGQVVSSNSMVTVREVSLGGLSFESPIPFPIGEVHEFKLTMGDDTSVVMPGRIVWIDEQTADDGSVNYITGVRFIDEESAESASPIGGLVDKLK